VRPLSNLRFLLTLVRPRHIKRYLSIFYRGIGFEICETIRYAKPKDTAARLEAALQAHQISLALATASSSDASYRCDSESASDQALAGAPTVASTISSTSQANTPLADITTNTLQNQHEGARTPPHRATVAPSTTFTGRRALTIDDLIIPSSVPSSRCASPVPESEAPRSEAALSPSPLAPASGSLPNEGGANTSTIKPVQPPGPDYRDLPVLDLAIRATKKFAVNDFIPFLSGSVADLTEEQNDGLERLQKDFSVVMNPNRRVHQLFLGPARFCNVRPAPLGFRSQLTFAARLRPERPNDATGEEHRFQGDQGHSTGRRVVLFLWRRLLRRGERVLPLLDVREVSPVPRCSCQPDPTKDRSGCLRNSYRETQAAQELAYRSGAHRGRR
jgi:hypothetical protein